MFNIAGIKDHNQTTNLNEPNCISHNWNIKSNISQKFYCCFLCETSRVESRILFTCVGELNMSYSTSVLPYPFLSIQEKQQKQLIIASPIRENAEAKVIVLAFLLSRKSARLKHRKTSPLISCVEEHGKELFLKQVTYISNVQTIISCRKGINRYRYISIPRYWTLCH